MNQNIEVPALARDEGEGALYVRLKDGVVSEIELNIYEPPRFFEGFLQGRYFQEVPDITARICGICPVAYQMSSVQALEAAMGVTITPQVRALRRLLYCAEDIESHALHIYMLQAPDLVEAVNIETERKLTAAEARAILASAPGVVVIDDPARLAYPMPASAAHTDPVFVGRIREDNSLEHGLNLWIVSDNLRKGAATNAVQIAELWIHHQTHHSQRTPS